MSDLRCQPSSDIQMMQTVVPQGGQAYAGHQYSGTSVNDKSSAHFGDVYNVYNNSHPAQGQAETPKRPSFFVPFRRDRDFVERPVLSEILQRTSQPAARVGLVGLGGVGKTQIAIEYAYRRRDAEPHTSVFWVHASSTSRFAESYRQIAQQLNISTWTDPNTDVRGLVHAWLSDESHGQWTMIVDNADSGEVMFGPRDGVITTSAETSLPSANPTVGDRSLSDYLPISPHGSIVVTSRSREVVHGLIECAEDVFNVGPMTKDDAVSLLTKKLQGRQQQDASQSELFDLVQELDYMPLAISQAAAYIGQWGSHMTVPRYLERLLKSDLDRDRLLQKASRDPRRDGQASNSIIITWHASFEHIRQTRESAARLLALMSLFDREGIPRSLLQGQYLSEEMEQFDARVTTERAQDEYELEDDLVMLSAYNMIGSGTANELFDMHRLVQFSTRKWLELRGELAYWQGRYFNVLDAKFPMFPVNSEDTWPACEALFPHVEAAKSHSLNSDDQVLKRALILYRAAHCARDIGRYKAAVEMVSVSLADRERVLGPDHVDTLASTGLLGFVLHDQGKFAHAIKTSRRAADGFEKQLGAKHPTTLDSLNFLALSLEGQGDYAEAAELHTHILALREVELGASHPETLASMHNLASILLSLGRYEEAEEKYTNVLLLEEKELGTTHSQTMDTKNDLALALCRLGKHSQALEMLQSVMTVTETHRGPNHPETLVVLNNVALVLRYQGQYQQAENMYRQTLAGAEKELGLNSSLALSVLNNLAQLLRLQGGDRLDEAKGLLEQALKGGEKELGPRHPKILDTIHAMATLLDDQKDYEKALQMYDRALEGLVAVLGSSHPDTNRCQEDRQSMLDEMNKPQRETA